MKAINLKVEHLKDPLGLQERKPLITWNCDEGLKQTAFAYRVEVNDVTVLESGKIEKNDMETYIRINKISIEKPTPTMEELFKTNQHMLSREYVMTHKKEVVIWTKESCPLSYFKV